MKCAFISAMAAAVEAKNFPTVDEFHAHCVLEVRFPDECNTVYQKFNDAIQDYVSKQTDPTGGSYSMVENFVNYGFWTVRTSQETKNQSDIRFTIRGFVSDPSLGTGCLTDLKSVSQ